MKALVGKQMAVALVFATALGMILSLSFITTSQRFVSYFLDISGWDHLRHHPGFLMLGFPVLAAFFAMSLRVRKKIAPTESLKDLAALSIVPLLVAFIFGWVQDAPSLFDLKNPLNWNHPLWWSVILAPVGEELLFRGWCYQVAERLWPDTYFTLTNPFPVPVWISSIAFSLWHLQNLSVANTGFVLFQVLYTLFTGFWLGYIRWKSGALWPAVLAHCLLNLMSILV